METETLDKLYLEWSQFTSARTHREIAMQRVIDAAKAMREDAYLVDMAPDDEPARFADSPTNIGRAFDAALAALEGK